MSSRRRGSRETLPIRSEAPLMDERRTLRFGSGESQMQRQQEFDRLGHNPVVYPSFNKRSATSASIPTSAAVSAPTFRERTFLVNPHPTTASVVPSTAGVSQSNPTGLSPSIHSNPSGMQGPFATSRSSPFLYPILPGRIAQPHPTQWSSECKGGISVSSQSVPHGMPQPHPTQWAPEYKRGISVSSHSDPYGMPHQLAATQFMNPSGNPFTFGQSTVPGSTAPMGAPQHPPSLPTTNPSTYVKPPTLPLTTGISTSATVVTASTASTTVTDTSQSTMSTLTASKAGTPMAVQGGGGHPPTLSTTPLARYSGESPKTALHALYGQAPRRKVVSAKDYYTWNDGGPPHALKWTSIFLCPVTGEVFCSGRCGEESSFQVQREATEVVVWYTKKTSAEHAAAARAVDCSRLRDGKWCERLSHDEPYREPVLAIPNFVPLKHRNDMEHRQAEILRQRQQDVIDVDQQARNMESMKLSTASLAGGSPSSESQPNQQQNDRALHDNLFQGM